jgi:cytolysin (calcineurin-like family phosphatase)
MRFRFRAMLVTAVILCFARILLARDVTFFVASDLHYGQDQAETNEQGNKNVIAIINKLPGADFPEKDFGSVATPRGVLLTGDLTDSGTGVNYHGYYLGVHLFDGFADDYPVKNGTGVHIHFPVYEGYGNHDVQKQTGDSVLRGIVSRNKYRDTPVNASSNGLHYSWDWDDVHFVNLNVYAGSAGDARDSLSFLQKDLADRVGKTQKPVVIMQHYGFDEFSTEDRWWKKPERDAFYKNIKDYNIAAIFTGHNHLCQRIVWNGIPDFIAPKARGENVNCGFFAVRMLDEKMIVAQSRYDNKWGEYWTHKLSTPK